MTNRRTFLIGGLGATFCAYESTQASGNLISAAAHGLASSSNAKVPLSVHVVPHSNKLFRAILDYYFPKLARHRRFRKLSRCAVLIMNNDPRDIYGYSVEWQNFKAGEVPDLYQRRFVNRPTLQLRARQITAQVPVLKAGSVALVTPYFTWTAESFAARPSRVRFGKRRLRRYQGHFPRAHGFTKRAKTADSVTVSVEALAFKDSVVGVRRQSFASFIRNSRNGERDQARAIYRGIQKSGDSTEAFRKSLFAGTLDSNTIGALKSPSYAKSRRRFAERMRHLLNTDAAQAQKILIQVASLRRSNIR